MVTRSISEGIVSGERKVAAHWVLHRSQTPVWERIYPQDSASPRSQTPVWERIYPQSSAL